VTPARCTRIQTHSGGTFDLLNPDPADVRTEDIAHALSQIARYTGHTDTPYSVATHSVHVSQIVRPGLASLALLHDAAEAYLGDWSTILKIATDLECQRAGARCYEYSIVDNPMRSISARVQDAILTAYGWDILPGFGDVAEHESEVKFADRAALTIEHRALMPAVPAGSDLHWPFIEGTEWGRVPSAARLVPLPQFGRHAKALFLDRARELGLRAVGDP
jgi:hypothetical protein